MLKKAHKAFSKKRLNLLLFHVLAIITTSSRYYVDFVVTLDGSEGDYLSVDMNKVSGKIANCQSLSPNVEYGQRVDASGSDDPANKGY